MASINPAHTLKKGQKKVALSNLAKGANRAETLHGKTPTPQLTVLMENIDIRNAPGQLILRCFGLILN
jgi:hypothetical protein